ncbi:hypothetical protein D4L85_15505 [Chryseolinea soli]|uniref:Lipocalin-like domain-containing protein n=2 Tax=Chryseolinea soli TaxID=2321403 RepID=A0A385SM26_9BACT|nr:hypothetical protein D4L85_15505 [Chryseolinea soli]
MDKTSAFSGFTLTFAANTYTAHEGSPVWASSGTWAFADENAASFTRDDDVLVTIHSLTSTHLTLSLISSYPVFQAGGRAESTTGEFVFEFNK